MDAPSDELRFTAMLAESGMDVPPDQLPLLFTSEGCRKQRHQPYRRSRSTAPAPS